MTTKLTQEEKGVLDSYENEKRKLVQAGISTRKYKAAARETLKKISV